MCERMRELYQSPYALLTTAELISRGNFVFPPVLILRAVLLKDTLISGLLMMFSSASWMTRPPIWCLHPASAHLLACFMKTN